MSHNGASFQFLNLTNYQVSSSPGFATWLAEQNVSVALTNTLGHRLFLIGRGPRGELSVMSQNYDRCMGLVALNSQTLYMVTRYQIWRLENALPEGAMEEDGYDRLYIPQMAHTTGHLNIHDLAITTAGEIYFVNTRFACLSSVSPQKSFHPRWKPPFITELAPEDRCHLNGLALRDDKPRYMTSFSQTNTAEGWREFRVGGGVVTDVTTNETVVTGLTMPHSPRYYRDELWLTNSGTGEFGRVDMERGRFEPLTFAPGFLRGLTFHGDYAIVGSSKPRHGDFFEGVPLQEELDRRHIDAVRGFFVVDLRTGEVCHWFALEGVTGEIYDVIVLPGVRRPKAIALNTDDIQNMVTVGPPVSLQVH
ncbi:MAG: TIGR03032 family protein [Chloroflexi bacterium]|nr:TIGR03032 family protein [Chloroflexota bacterium]MBP8056741.1 TIGR03032 family protein [Chloroflexota bacterium]